MPTISLLTPSSAERRRLIDSDLIRSRALKRLYERKSAVEGLIRCIEDYQRINTPLKSRGIEI